MFCGLRSNCLRHLEAWISKLSTAGGTSPYVRLYLRTGTEWDVS